MWFLEFCASIDKFIGLLGRIAFMLFTLSPIILFVWILWLLAF
ncbi:hypothetical protein [uncultured Halomonas sp.]|nr:hypothetical protein [uncultured Halomonas sp.]